MYALVMLFVALGYLAVVRALERPSLAPARGGGGRHRAAALHALLVVLAARGRRRDGRRSSRSGATAAERARAARGARRARGRRAHVRAVGAVVPLPAAPHRDAVGRAGEPVRELGGGVHARSAATCTRPGWMLLVLVAARRVRGGDRGRRPARDPRPAAPNAACASRPRSRSARSALGLVVGRLSGTTFEGRYASVAFPLFVAVGRVRSAGVRRSAGADRRARARARARRVGRDQQRRPAAHAGVPARPDHPRRGRAR